MIQYLIVGVIVLLAALHAAGKYLPKTLRQRIVHKLTRGTGKGRVADWLGADAGCGSGCDSCGTCETEALPEQDAQGRKIIQVHVQR